MARAEKLAAFVLRLRQYPQYHHTYRGVTLQCCQTLRNIFPFYVKIKKIGEDLTINKENQLKFSLEEVRCTSSFSFLTHGSLVIIGKIVAKPSVIGNKIYLPCKKNPPTCGGGNESVVLQ